jgi:hypothetical protein
MKSTRQMLKDGLKPLEKTPSGRSAGPKGKRSDYPGLDFTPPKKVQLAAELGIGLRIYVEEVLGRKRRPGGTEIGVARALQLAWGRKLTPRGLRRMKSYFARHAVDKSAKGWGDEDNPSPGYVAWLLWGGDEGSRWATRMVAEMDRFKKNR